MHRPGVLIVKTTVPITQATLAECWNTALAAEFNLPEFEVILNEDEIMNWLRHKRISRTNPNERMPKFRRVIEEGDPLEVVTGISQRVIQVTERSDGRYLLQIDFVKASTTCAAKILDRLPHGIYVEIDAISFGDAFTLEWVTGNKPPGDILVDMYARSAQQVNDDAKAGIVVPTLMGVA